MLLAFIIITLSTETYYPAVFCNMVRVSLQSTVYYVEKWLQASTVERQNKVVSVC